MSVRFTFDAEKANEAIAFLASQGLRGLSKYKLCKLLFLADKHHLVRFGRPITGDRICAMDHGPVPSSVLNLLNNLLNENLSSPEVQALWGLVDVERRYTHPHFVAKRNFQQFALSVSDIEALSAVAEEHGRKTFGELKALTHEMVAYKRAWDNRDNDAPPMAFEDLFEEDEEALAGVFEEMVETDAMRKRFGAPF